MCNASGEGLQRKRGQGQRGSVRKSIIAAALCCIVSASAITSCGRERSSTPNLILIIVDTLRADHLGCYGYNKIETPDIDKLAADGVLFENAVTHAPLTLPSISSIMTSTLPPTTGVHYNEGFRLDASALTLAEILSEEGYLTGAVAGAVVLDSINGISQGFSRYDDDFGAFNTYLPHVKLLESQLNHTQRRAGEVTDLGIDMAATMSKEGPFFMFLHYFDPHSPYDPPPPFSSRGLASEEGSPEIVISRYDGEIAYADAQIGRLLDDLEQKGLIKNSLVVLTADHGEGLGEHGEKSHGYLTYEGTLHIPLIFSMPGRIPEGKRITGLASHIDVVPTILDILGVDRGGLNSLNGRSLYPFDDYRATDYSYFEGATSFVVFGWCALRGVRTASWKYIEAPRKELYDLLHDPGEENNLIDQTPRVADSLRSAMEEIIAEAPLFAGGTAGREMSMGDAQGQDADYVEKLRALGYIGAPKKVSTGYEEMFDSSLPDPKDMIEAQGRQETVLERLVLAERLVSDAKFKECLQLLAGLDDSGDQGWRIHYQMAMAYIGVSDDKRAGEELRTGLGMAPIGPGRVRIRELMRFLETRH